MATELIDYTQFPADDDFELVATVVKAVLKQGMRSLAPDRSSCAYRGNDGRKCAIGMLMPDDFYQAMMAVSSNANMWTVLQLLTRDELEQVRIRFPDFTAFMRRKLAALVALQKFHDVDRSLPSLKRFSYVCGFDSVKWDERCRADGLYEGLPA